MNPKARRDGIVEQALPGELLLYDETKSDAYCMNRTMALIWRACDGERSPAEIASAVAAELGTPVPEEVVHHALGKLRDAGLLEVCPPLEGPRLIPRRFFLQGATMAMALVPMLAAIHVPPAFAAGSPSPLMPLSPGTPGSHGSPSSNR